MSPGKLEIKSSFIYLDWTMGNFDCPVMEMRQGSVLIRENQVIRARGLLSLEQFALLGKKTVTETTQFVYGETSGDLFYRSGISRTPGRNIVPGVPD
jgi:hypothetical protein